MEKLSMIFRRNGALIKDQDLDFIKFNVGSYQMVLMIYHDS